MTEKPVYLFVDESGTDTSSGVLLVSVVVTEEPERIREIIGQYLDQVKRDPEQKKLSGVAQAKSFHYTSDHGEIKTHLIESIIPGLNFDGYVSFIRKKEVSDGSVTSDLITKALSALLFGRLHTNHYREIHFVYENPGNPNERKIIRQTVEEMGVRVAQHNGGKETVIHVDFADKSELCLSVADYIGGVVRGYLQAKGIDSIPDSKMQDTLLRQYNRIVGKLRVLNDYSRHQFHTRQTSMFIDS